VAAVQVASPQVPSPPVPRPRWLIALGVAILLVGLATAALHLRSQQRDTRPVVLPDTFAGWTTAPQAQQFAETGDWRTQLAKVYAGNAFDGRAYGTRRPVQLLNLVVARSGDTGVGDVRLGVAPYTEHGEVRCTHTFTMPDGAGPAKEAAGMLLCFRAETQLTVSVLALGNDQDEARIAAGIDDVWALQG